MVCAQTRIWNKSLRYKPITQSWLEDQTECKSTRRKELEDFAVPDDQRMKINEGKKMDKYLDFVRELTILWNVKVTVLLVVVEIDTKNLENRLGEFGD